MPRLPDFRPHALFYRVCGGDDANLDDADDAGGLLTG